MNTRSALCPHAALTSPPIAKRQVLAWRASLGTRRALIAVVYAALVMAIGGLLFLCLVFGVKFTNAQVRLRVGR